MLISEFANMHKLQHKIDEQSPELCFMRHICEGGTAVGTFFTEKMICGRDVVLDAPSGTYTGLDQLRQFAEKWLERADAVRATVLPVVQTIAGGRAVSEIEVWFEQRDGQVLKVPMAVFGDLGTQGKLEGMRIYYFYQWLPGTPAYRRPIFRPSFMTWAELPMMTGVVRHYYEQLHNGYTDEALEKIVDMAADNVRYGGYRPQEAVRGKEEFRQEYVGITDTIPRDAYVRFETITDDGVNCLVEWTTVVRMSGLRAGRVSQAGMAAYERDTDGKLASVRICDNVGFEDQIDRNTISPDDMFIDS